MIPKMTTIIFIYNAALFSEISFLRSGRTKSSKITPVMEFRPVDIVLKEKIILPNCFKGSIFKIMHYLNAALNIPDTKIPGKAGT